jgi:hypothetical protein
MLLNEMPARDKIEFHFDEQTNQFSIRQIVPSGDVEESAIFLDLKDVSRFIEELSFAYSEVPDPLPRQAASSR